jgi:hypothetical protein
MVCPGIAPQRATGAISGFGPGRENAIVGIDLADKKQSVVVTNHDSAAGRQDLLPSGLGAQCCVVLSRRAPLRRALPV